MQALITTDTVDGFYFDRFGIERKCIIATSRVHLGATSAPLVTRACDLNGDDLDPDLVFALGLADA